MTTAADVLLHARGLIEAGWSKGAMARDECGEATFASGESAVTFCTQGAIWRAAIDLGGGDQPYFDAMGILTGLAVPPHGTITLWNDAPERTISDVIDLFDEALHEAKA